ncbi:hypothetical protein MBSD_n0026 [Mizugakiibacter sediminis]|uniref:DUF1318 domain-containing protein n=1 Tax=Mizugakiibacter sediminis TaxID=1475481 RepID=A0A0K8QIU9_9GAMM|nr:YdbL family protein [Mizugakiibacter sediminis]GAP64744.1 hypothetical protein MBSD_n0026 [Mizugakiibacter sediminis]
MRKTVVTLAAAFALLAGCVTINVYFPAAAAEKAAQQFVDKVIGPETQQNKPAEPAKPAKPEGDKGGGALGALLDFVVPAAQAAEPDLNLKTPEIETIRARMAARFQGALQGFLDSGAVGFANDGSVAVRDATAAPLAQRAQLQPTVAAENADRDALYRAIAAANGHPEWESQIRKTFARTWVERAHAGWYYQDASGAWKRK